MIKQDRSIVFFDADCSFCSRSVQFIYRYDSDEHFDFAKLGGEAYRRQVLNLKTAVRTPKTSKGTPDSLLLLTPEGKLLWSWEAITYIYQRLNFSSVQSLDWSLKKMMDLIPNSIGNAMYLFVAKNRYLFSRMFSKSCSVGLKNKILD